MIYKYVLNSRTHDRNRLLKDEYSIYNQKKLYLYN